MRGFSDPPWLPKNEQGVFPIYVLLPPCPHRDHFFRWTAPFIFKIIIIIIERSVFYRS